MASGNANLGLRGKLLIAMPGMGDPRFEKSVVFLCEHSDQGAMGLIINKTADISFADLAVQLDLCKGPPATLLPVHFGGPVEHGRGFVLHSPDYDGSESTMKINPAFRMSATLDILQDIADGNGPSETIFALGYSGWGPGQLEAEIQENGWLTCDASPEIVFDQDDEAKWTAALKTLGVDAVSLSATAGRA